MQKTRFAVFCQIVFHAVAGKCDHRSAGELPRLAEQFDTGAIGQSDIAQNQVELLLAQFRQRIGDVPADGHGMPHVSDDPRNHCRTVFMILDH